MVFDKTKPANTTKLRNVGEVIRPNWDAIEAGEATFKPQALNLADRDDAGLASNPTAIAHTIILYSKQDGDSKPQAYAIDPDSIITKLTGGSLTDASPGKYVMPNGLTFIWGSAAATTAWLEKTFALSGFANNCFHISGNAIGSTEAIGYEFVSKTKFKVKGSSGTPTFYYFAIGN